MQPQLYQGGGGQLQQHWTDLTFLADRIRSTVALML